jgi:hypothetical protein
MPIVELPRTGSSLSQGDILERVAIFATKRWLAGLKRSTGEGDVASAEAAAQEL